MSRRAFAKAAVLLALATSACSAIYLRRLADPCRISLPKPERVTIRTVLVDPPALYRDDGGCIEYVGPADACPRYKIPLADGRLVDLVDVRPGT
jgi:hypothetical protein